MPNVKKQIKDGKHTPSKMKKISRMLTADVELPKANRSLVGTGRPKYKQELCDMLIESGEKGLTKIQFCAQIGISQVTFYEWRDSHPEFREAVAIFEMKYTAWYTSLVKNLAMGIMPTVTSKDGKTITKLNLNLGGLIWLGKNTTDWKDRHEQSISVGTKIVEVSKEENELI